MHKSFFHVLVLLLMMPVAALAQSDQVDGNQAEGALEDLRKAIDTPLTLEADAARFDETENILTAQGNVEVSFEGQVLMADSLTYDALHDRVIADGNVQILDKDGNIYFSDRIDLKDRMRTGTLERLYVQMQNQAHFHAESARRTQGIRTDFRNGSYTRCELCQDSEPLWQLKAKRITHLQESRRLEYRDATLEIKGVPVAYIPYMRHPDPAVARESGFLIPTIGSSSVIGSFVATPYFQEIGESADITFNPIVTSKYGLILHSVYRQTWARADVNIDASINRSDRTAKAPGIQAKPGNRTKGHIFADGSVDINEHWRTRLSLNRAHDRNYLRNTNLFEPQGDDLRSQAV
ncbi:MAG: hypothetical protein AAF352_04505, partial [Pseudomonadota bacterium]